MTLVEDAFGAAGDSVMTTIPLALDAPAVLGEFAAGLPVLTAAGTRMSIDRIRVTRYKTAKRCLIEYAISLEQPDGTQCATTLIGKIQAKRFGKSGLRTLQAFWQRGFDATSGDHISVPKPIGHIDVLQIWLQRKVPGVGLSDLITPQSAELMAQVAEAAVKIHRSGAPTERAHAWLTSKAQSPNCRRCSARFSPVRCRKCS